LLAQSEKCYEPGLHLNLELSIPDLSDSDPMIRN